MKKIIALVLAMSIALTACSSGAGKNQVVDTEGEITGVSEPITEANGGAASEVSDDRADGTEENDDSTSPIDFSKYQAWADQEIADENLAISDDRIQRYLEDKIYLEALENFDSDDYVIDSIETTYYSKEYIENLLYNSQENIYFGFTQAELDQQFAGKKYVFTLGENGETTVTEVETYEDHATEEILKDVAIGSGVLLICVTVSVATGGVAPAVSMIFAVGAKTGTVMALSGGVIGGLSAGIVEGYQTGNFDNALQAAAVGTGEGFKLGAITGALSGSASETWGLYKATAGGLNMNQVAVIQKDSKYPLSLIKNFHSLEEYEAFKEAGLKTMMVDGKTALVQNIDLNYIDEATGKTNLELMQGGNAPIDTTTGKPFELHHIGQKEDSPLAVLNWEQHRGKGNFKALHEFLNKVGTENPSSLPGWTAQKENFWMDMAKQLGGAL